MVVLRLAGDPARREASDAHWQETGGSACRISASTSSVGMPRSITQMRSALPYWASILRKKARNVALSAVFPGNTS